MTQNQNAQEILLKKLKKCQVSFEYYEKTNQIDQFFDTHFEINGDENLELNYLESQGRSNVSLIFGKFN